jgi:hypothetical protein
MYKSSPYANVLCAKMLRRSRDVGELDQNRACKVNCRVVAGEQENAQLGCGVALEVEGSIVMDSRVVSLMIYPYMLKRQ